MFRFTTAALAGAAVIVTGVTAGAQTSSDKTSQTPSTQTRQITLTGCVVQASDDPRMFALVPAADAEKPTGTSGTASIAPLYRLEDKGMKLKGHTGQRVEVSGSVTPAKDEKGADIVTSRRERGWPGTISA